MDEIIKVCRADICWPGQTRPLLSQISFSLKKGEHHVLWGKNGSGKSTFLRLLAGEICPSDGHISWMGKDGPETSRIIAHKIVRLVSPAFQELWQRHGWNLTGMEILASAHERTPFVQIKPDEASQKATMTILEELDCPELCSLPMPAMSQGQLRLLLLARAILARPKVLLLDEYLDGIDAGHGKKLAALLEKAAGFASIIFTTHRLESVTPWIKSFWEMRDGKLCPAPKPAPTAAVREKTTIPVQNPGLSQAVFELRNVNVFINRQHVLHDINWTIRRGENWQIGGPNGSGKSTLLRLLAGDEFVAAGGGISFYGDDHGKDYGDDHGKERNFNKNTLAQLRKNIHLLSDLSQAHYDYDITGLELICSGLDNSVGIYREYAPEEIQKAWLLLFKIAPGEAGLKAAETSIRKLSTGLQRGLFLARALISRPPILLLDEACNGLDAESRARFLAFLDEAAINGIDGYRPQLIFVSHYDNDIPACVNRHALMRRGKLAVID